MASQSAHAHLCDGDPSSAMVWDEATQITVRLSLRGDEIWILAGSRILVRLIAPSDGEFDKEGIAQLLDGILRGDAVEYFGVHATQGGDLFATGFEIEPAGAAGGLNNSNAGFRARLAGPLASASLDLSDAG